MGTAEAWDRTKYVLDTYMRSKYIYNALLLEGLSKLELIYVEVCRLLCRLMLKSKDECIKAKVIRRLQTLLKTQSLKSKTIADAVKLIKKLKEKATIETDGVNKNAEKVKKHSERCLCLIEQGWPTARLKSIASEDVTKEKVKMDTLEE